MKKLGMHTLSIWFGAIMILLVTGMAFAFTFTDLMSERLSGTRRTFFIVILLAYAVYRSFRLSQALKQQRYEN